MGSITRFEKGQEKHSGGDAVNSSICPVCDGKGYSLVATRRVNSSQTIYEKQDCQQCVSVPTKFTSEKKNEASAVGRKRLSGTGYLRNKKRRRKDESQGEPG